jgi:outer membrane protein assembly factor BamA
LPQHKSHIDPSRSVRLKFLFVTNFTRVATLAACFVCWIASAQTARKQASKDSASDHKLVSIHVTGSQRYSREEITAACGLTIGSNATEDDFKKATQGLGETGLFSNISYSFAYSPAGTKLDLQLTDSDKMVPARFENFVWFSDQELIAKIHESLPLFRGQVPVGGDFSDQVSDSLQALLLQHSLAARADYIRDAQENDGPIVAVNFRVTGINLRVHELTVPNASPAEQAALSAAAKKLEGAEYLRSQVVLFAKATLLPIYRERGFLKANFSDPQTKVFQDDPTDTQVDIALPVNPGLQYKTGKFTWDGNTAFPAEKLQSLIRLQPGQPANAVQLDWDLEAIHKLYGTVGRMTESVTPEAEFDDAASSVAYKFHVHEGEVFHLGDVDIQGLDSKLTDRVRDAWTLQAEDPYDSGYAKRFVDQAWKLLPSNPNWTVSIHEGVNEKDKTVDVTLRYGQKP